MKVVQQDLRSFQLDDWLILAVITSLFLTPNVSALVLIGILGISLLKKNLIHAIKNQPGALWIYSFIILEVLVSTFAQNWTGLVNALGMGLVMGFIAIYREKIHPRLFVYCVEWMLILSFFIGIYALFQFNEFSLEKGYSFFEFHVQNSPKRRIMATFENANLYATMLEMWIFLGVYRFFTGPSLRHRIWIVLISLFNLGLLYLTGCRTAFLPFVIIIPLFLWLSKEKVWFWISLVCLLFCIGAVCLNPDFLPRITDLSTLESRFKIWRCALIGIAHYPFFGLGPQSYGIYYQLYDGHKAPHCHNIYLDSIASYGIIGTLMLLIYFFRYLGKEILSVSKLSQDRYLFGLMIGMLGIFLIHGLLDVTMNVIATSVVFLMVLNARCVYKNG